MVKSNGLFGKGESQMVTQAFKEQENVKLKIDMVPM